MRRAVRFYRALGFVLRHGGEDASFTSFVVGPTFLNLEARPSMGPAPSWGRAIFYVSDVDAIHRRACELGLSPPAPADAPWGERFFHVRDPDGHELSFAKPL
jgi:catechol 2,3-dioxygenase-like lactoylglutathione lyase family enzyme